LDCHRRFSLKTSLTFHEFRDTPSCDLLILMLPYSDHSPSKSTHFPVSITISSLIRPYLLGPPLAVRGFWQGAMAGAPMPETPIYEDSYPRLWKQNIDGSSETWNSLSVNPKPQAHPMEKRSKA
jgi:hypothetical protein